MERITNWKNVPIVLSTKETENLLGIKAKTIRKMARNKEIPAKKINNEWKFLKDELFKWIKQKKGEKKNEY